MSPPETAHTPGFRERLLNLLSRRTSTGMYLPEVDGLRSLAIGLVILYHVQNFIDGQHAYAGAYSAAEETFRSLLVRGSFGVQVFFAISGFIIALPFVLQHRAGGRPVRLRNFYTRRVTRLEPPYIINLLFNSGIKFVVDRLAPAVIAGHFLAGLAYSHSLIFGAHNRLNEALWSLEIEFQFYLLAPAFLLAFLIRRPLLRRATLVAPLVLLMALRPDVFRVDKSLLGKAEYFFVGILLADVYVTGWRSALPRKRRYDLLALAGWAGFFVFICAPASTIVVIARPACLFAAFLGTLGGRHFSAVFRNAWISTFGGMCYTVYLYHSTIMGVVVRLTKARTVSGSYFVTYFEQLALNLVPIVLISPLLFILLEKPFMDKNWPAQLRTALTRSRGTLFPAATTPTRAPQG